MSKSHIEEYLGNLLEVESPAELAATTQIQSQHETANMKPPVEDSEKNAWYMLNISGLNVAVRVKFIVDVVPASRMQEKESAFNLGSLTIKDRQIQVVNLAQILSPKGKLPAKKPRYIAILRDKPYGIACQQSQKVQFQEEQVCWRTQNTTRPWLAGTVMAKKCALIDVEALIPMLAGDGKN